MLSYKSGLMQLGKKYFYPKIGNFLPMPAFSFILTIRSLLTTPFHVFQVIFFTIVSGIHVATLPPLISFSENDPL